MTPHRIGGGRDDTGFQFGRVFLIVVGLHAVVGLGVLWLAKTSAGQQFAKTYDIKLFTPEPPEQPEEPPKPEEAPPPPPPPLETPQVEAPKLAATAPSAAPPAPTIGGGGAGRGGANWSGGRFVGGFGDGPEGAFHAGITRLFREAYREPATSFGPAEILLDVSGSGEVRSFRLAKSSGDPSNDRALLEAARAVQARGTPPPPESKGREVKVRFYPY